MESEDLKNLVDSLNEERNNLKLDRVAIAIGLAIIYAFIVIKLL